MFIDEMGVLLGLTWTHARSNCGSRVYDFKPYYRGAKVSVIRGQQLKVGVSSHDARWLNGW